MENVYMIAAGGTGGHFYPGFALGKKLIERGHDVVFIIRRGSPSAKLLDKNDISYRETDCIALPRGKNVFRWAVFPFRLLASILRMRSIIKEYNPVVCIGMGGYAAFPMIFAAHYLGVKTVLHDSNAKIGLTNRVCSKFADLFLLGLPVVDKPSRAVLTGTPVREEFKLKESVEEQNYWRFATGFGINILIFGGSQGARSLNFAAVETVKNLLQKTQRLYFLHITGRRDYEEIKNLYGNSDSVEVIPYTEDIYSLMKAAHLIVSRSGASSLAEIICLKKPSILVPYPYAAGNHQYYNARVLTDRGCALMLRESLRLAQDLAEMIKQLLAACAPIKQMSAKFDNSHLPDPLEAADYCALVIEKLVKGRRFD
jgi:UDP-N-acetylglucosamine--N-acetylmuramyl-(pentapeptide) pyrophosphoryl-undecaprenol N-acetylglucosamine transferase